MRHLLPTSRGHIVVPARSLGLAVVIGAGLLLPACSEEPPTDEANAVAPNGVPRISFVTLSHDFGALPDTKSVRTSFAFSNTGTGKLVITGVKANCGCTVPTLAKSELLPGEGSAIDVIFEPAGRAGDLAKHISVVSNAQPENVTRLTISAHVEPTVRVDTKILNLGDLRLGQENRTYFNVYYRNPQVEITRIEVDNPHLTARLAGPGTGSPVNEQGEHRATIEVVVDEDAPWGVIDRANLTFTARAPAAAGADQTPVSYRVLVVGALYGDLQAEPRYLSPEGLLVQGQPFAATAVLSRLSGAPFTITDIQVKDSPVPDAIARFEQISAGEYRILLEGRAPATPGGLNGSVALRTDVPGEENLVMLLSAYVKK
jgi:hypothetical protein